jgi:hypothetical protein
MWGSLQPSSKESETGRCSASRTKQMPRDGNSKDECCTKEPKQPPPIYQHPWPVATNNFFAPLSNLPMENAETGSERNSTKTPGSNESTGKGGPPPIILTLEVNFISLQRELKNVVSGQFFQNIATESQITSKSMVD